MQRSSVIRRPGLTSPTSNESSTDLFADRSLVHVEDDERVQNTSAELSNEANSLNIKPVAVSRCVKIPLNEGALGARLMGPADTSAHRLGVFLYHIAPDSKAASVGLQSGDRLLTINGVDVSGASHSEVVNLLGDGNAAEATVISQPEILANLDRDEQVVSTLGAIVRAKSVKGEPPSPSFRSSRSPAPLQTSAVTVHHYEVADISIYPGTTYILKQEPRISNWKDPLPQYTPVRFTALGGLPPQVDRDDIENSNPAPAFNSVDVDGINRQSLLSENYAVEKGYPLNPTGRTGITGRGALARYGPNHTATAIVTRWARHDDAAVVVNNEPVLEMIAIRLPGSDFWHLPCAPVGSGEDINAAIRRAFAQEALNLPSLASLRDVNKAFTSRDSKLIFAGVVRDPRNTDNAWTETSALNVHCSEGFFDNVILKAGAPAVDVQWVRIERNTPFSPADISLVKLSCEARKAYCPLRVMSKPSVRPMQVHLSRGNAESLGLALLTDRKFYY